MIIQNPAARKIYRQVVIILISAFIVKIIFAFAIPTEIRSDSIEYYELGKNLVTMGEYSFDGKITALRSCGYPLFISGIFYIFGDGQLWIKIIQAFLEITGGIFFFLICRNFTSDRYSVIGLLIFSFLPSNLLYSQVVLSESLFGVLMSVLIYYSIKEKIDWKIFFIGMLWGYAILVRSSFILSIFLTPLFIFIYRKKLFEGFRKKRILRAFQYTLLFATGSLIVISPWLIRNKIQFDSFTIATQGGLTFWTGSNPDATGTSYYKYEESNPLFKMQDEIRQDKEFYKLGIEYAINNPHKFLILGVKKLGYVFSSERMIILCFTQGDHSNMTSTEVYKTVNPLISGVINIPYFLIMLMGIWGLLAIDRKKFIVYGFLITWCLTFVLYIGLARYHFVLIPFFIIGTIILLQQRKNIFKKLNLFKILAAIIFDLFLLAVWVIEFYLLLNK